MVFAVVTSSAVSIALYAKVSSVSHQRAINGLTQELSRKQGAIEAKEGQLLAMAREVNGLKGALLELHAFEKKICVIASLGPDPKGDYLFGVGGAIPEDMDPSVLVHEQGAVLVREMGEQISEAKLAAEEEMVRFVSLYDVLDRKRSILESTPAIRPARGWLSSKFGARTSPFTGKKSFHKGYDIANHVGTPVIAPADGVVTYAGRLGSMGNMVSIDHGHGMVTRYGHLSKLIIKSGEQVKRGEKIALMGNTGRSTGPHLHYEVRVNGMAVDPAKYILD